MSDWQLIEAAPTDGTRVLLSRVHDGEHIGTWIGYFGDVVIRYSDRDAHTFQRVWVNDDREHLLPTPTHWMPLPDPPVPSGERRT